MVVPVRFGVTRASRAAMKGQRPCVIWMTGLSAAGKSTIARILDCRLHAQGRHAYALDGDNLRTGINRDLGFDPNHRAENVRRVAEIARLMVDAGLIVIAALISPFREDRSYARSLFDPEEFIEVHVRAPLHIAEARDPKGLYRRARLGKIAGFTGIDSPYELPEAPEIDIDTTAMGAEEAAESIITWMMLRAYLQPPRAGDTSPADGEQRCGV